MAALTVTALAALAIVTQDRVALRAAPRDTAAQHALLWQGDNLEIRGTKGDFLQVYDHRHERAGYVRAAQVRQPDLAPAHAPELMAVVRFLRDTPGAETLGLAHAAAYLQAAPADAIDGDVFDALGTMAERLAQRANDAKPGHEAQAATAHLDVAASYGITMLTVATRDDSTRLCYDGDAHRRVLALPASDEQKARAALALTRHECVSSSLSPTERHALDQWRADVLDRARTHTLPPVLVNRLHMRKAGVWASLAWQRARQAAAPDAVRVAAQRAVDELAAINKAELADTDATSYNLAAMRVGASRWATEAGLPIPNPQQPAATAKAAMAAEGSGNTPTTARVKLVLEPGEPGETCIRLLPVATTVATTAAGAAPAAKGHATPVFSRCTYGQVWPASAQWHPQGQALALAVQPTDTWRELWLIRQDADGWHADVLPPAAEGPGLGYIDWAGWVPGSPQLLTAREASTEGPYPQRYEVRRLDTLAVQAQADKPGNLSLFYRWQAPAWKARTVSLR
ncbi:MAG TPA: hypothetical protein VFY35_08115 [Burkholderiaceae bacterium]|nr:hypothetical protein [Burkholderiaceae bacterium]